MIGPGDPTRIYVRYPLYIWGIKCTPVVIRYISNSTDNDRSPWRPLSRLVCTDVEILRQPDDNFCDRLVRRYTYDSRDFFLQKETKDLFCI